MLNQLFDAVMDRRARHLTRRVRAWLPTHGPFLDLGSGTGHFSARLERALGVDVITADVCDIHVAGRPPVLIADGVLPFDDRTFSAALLVFVLSYPNDPTAVLAETARVTSGPIVVVQSVHSNRIGYAWLRMREFLWTRVGFQLARSVGYVARNTEFTMSSPRFYTPQALQREVVAAGLRIRSRRERRVLPDGSLVVAQWILERASAPRPKLQRDAVRRDV